MAITNPSLDQINSMIAKQMLGYFFPCVTQNSYSSLQNQLAYIQDMIGNLTYDPSYKFLSLSTEPLISEQSKSFNIDTWNGLHRRLSSNLNH